MRRPRALLLAVAATVTVACFILAEVALRLLSPIDRTLYQPDDLLLYAPKPNARKVFVRTRPNGGESVEVRFNGRGDRGPELMDDPRKRVVLYGDSYLEADWTPLAGTFAANLQRRLDGRLGGSVEVVNAGVASYGPDQAGLRMQRELDVLRPDLVVLAVFSGNDFGDLLRNRIFALDADGRLVRSPHPLDRARLDVMRRAAFPSWVRSLQLVTRVEASYDWFVGGVARTIDPPRTDYLARALELSRQEYVDAVVEPTPFALDLFDDHYDADIAVEPDAPSSRYKIELMAQMLPWIRDACENAHVPLVVLVIPSPIDVCDHYFGSVDPALYPRYDRSRLSAIVSRIAARSGVPTLDLLPALRERAEKGECLYFHDGDNHLDESGQELAARLFDEFLAARGQP